MSDKDQIEEWKRKAAIIDLFESTPDVNIQAPALGLCWTSHLDGSLSEELAAVEEGKRVNAEIIELGIDEWKKRNPR